MVPKSGKASLKVVIVTRFKPGIMTQHISEPMKKQEYLKNGMVNNKVPTRKMTEWLCLKNLRY